MRQLDDLGIVHTCDVAIVGGGNAGINAAISAAERGVDVLVVEKADPARSGSIAGGVDHFWTYLETGPDWDTREAFLDYVGRGAKGAINLKVTNAMYCEGGRDLIIHRFAQAGSPVWWEDGRFRRAPTYGAQGLYMASFNGKHLKFNLFKLARKHRARMLPRVTVTSLLKHGDRVAGLVGVNPRSGEFHIVRARAIILSTGNTNRVYQNPTGYRFNTWQCPANTGAAQAMALAAGAALANMEYMRWTVVPKGFSAAGLAALTSLGGRFINAAGEEFMYRYHPQGARAPRHAIVAGVYAEIMAGRGPVYVDCTRLDPDNFAHLRQLLGYDKDTLPDFIEQQGVDLATQPLEVFFSEGMQSGPSEHCASGIVIDEQGMSTIPGLFAAGDCADQNRCLHLSAAGGAKAGESAARWVTEHPELPPVDVASVARARAYALEPLAQRSGIFYDTVEDEIAQLMWQHCGPVRTADSLARALRGLEGLRERVEHLQARDPHDLMRVHEVKTMWQVAVVTVLASQERKESRFGPYFQRGDYPETREEYCGQFLVRQREGERYEMRFRPLTYEIPPTTYESPWKGVYRDAPGH